MESSVAPLIIPIHFTGGWGAAAGATALFEGGGEGDRRRRRRRSTYIHTMMCGALTSRCAWRRLQQQWRSRRRRCRHGFCADTQKALLQNTHTHTHSLSLSLSLSLSRRAFFFLCFWIWRNRRWSKSLSVLSKSPSTSGCGSLLSLLSVGGNGVWEVPIAWFVGQDSRSGFWWVILQWGFSSDPGGSFFFRSCFVQDGNSSSLSSAAVEGGTWSTAATKPDN